VNRKHLIQFVAAAAGLLLLYVLSYAPLITYTLAKHGKNGRAARIEQIYRPILRLVQSSTTFGYAYERYIFFWVEVFPPKVDPAP
jgi:hypothetical protein